MTINNLATRLAFTFILVLVSSLSCAKAEQSHENSFVRSYFATNHSAIVFPNNQSMPFEPGDIVELTSFSLVNNLESCISEELDKQTLVRTHQPPTYLSLDSDYWRTSFDVELETGSADGDVEISISRNDHLTENGLETFSSELWFLQENVGDLIQPECVEYYNGSKAGNLEEEPQYILIDKLFTFAGDLNLKSTFEVAFIAGVEISASKLVPHIRRFDWLSKLTKKFVSFEGKITGDSIQTEHSLMRFPSHKEGFDRSYLAFRPRFIKTEIMKELTKLVANHQDEIALARTSEKEAMAFLDKYKALSLNDHKSLVYNIFTGSEHYKNVAASKDAEAISLVLEINALAGYIRIKTAK